MKVENNKMEVLFVHLGPPVPSILYRNIAWLQETFTDLRLNLATDAEHDKFKLSGAEIYGVPKTSEIYALTFSPHSTVFRKGYWLHTMRRLLLIEEFHRTKPDTPLVHIESDMLLLKNFPFKDLQNLEHPAWPPVSEVHDSPGIIYSPNSKASQWLSQQVRKQITQDKSMTDMQVLKAISREFNYLPLHLPVSPKSISEKSGRTGTAVGFKGVFDGATLGLWLAGNDPRNKWGIIERHKNHSGHIPDTTKVEFRMSEKKELCVRESGSPEFVPLYNLHLHSKEIRFFKVGDHERQLMTLYLNYKRQYHRAFSIRGFLGALNQLREAGFAKLSKILNLKG